MSYWLGEFFDEEYGSMMLDNRNLRKHDSIATTNFISKNLNLKSGSVLFDQCCGLGRISFPIAERGVNIFGIDLSHDYIAHAQKIAEERKVKCIFSVADAMKYRTPELCDGAINWFTSVGYYRDDANNLEVLRRAFESLKVGGKFAIEYFHLPKVFEEFKEPKVIDLSSSKRGRVRLTDTRTFNVESGMCEINFLFQYEDGYTVTKEAEVRMYQPSDLIGMLEFIGFKVFSVFGNLKEGKVDDESKSVIIICEKQ